MFKRKKLSPIERRMEELQKEILRVNRDIKTVARVAPAAVEAPDVKPPSFQDRPAPASEPAATSPASPAAPSELDPGAGDLFTYASKSPPVSNPAGELFADLPTKSVAQARTAPPPGTHDQRTGREKFAHYFMAGHFPNLRPSRQESRVLRNKAIVMLIVVTLAAIWLLYYLRSH